MLSSWELRWLYDGSVPDPVMKWFETGLGMANHLPLDAELPRDDYYLPLKGTDSIGIKLSRGRLELKRRSKNFKYTDQGGISGRAEYWSRWAWNDKKRGARVQEVMDRFDWVRVNKRRIQRKYNITKGQLTEIPNIRSDAECAIEITSLELPNSHWWSLAIDSYGDQGRANRKNLSLAVNLLLSYFPIAKPMFDWSYGYPKWILMMLNETTMINNK